MRQKVATQGVSAMMHQNLGVVVRIAPAKLIQALKRNKEAHGEDYRKALAVWFVDLRERAALIIADAADEKRDADYHVNLPAPLNNEKLYDKYIGMFSLATDETLEISSEDYGCIVDDNWDWAVRALSSNSAYSAKFRG